MLVWCSCGIAPQKFDQTQGQAKLRALSLLHSELEKDSQLRRCLAELLIFRRADCASRTAIATKIGFVLIIPGRAPIRRHIQGPHETLAGLALFLVPFS